jgi:hypothetical protein
VYQTFLAHRTGPQQEFGRLEAVDTLRTTDSSLEDGFISDDGLHLFYRRAAPGLKGDLYVAWRRSIEERFETSVSLALVNSAYDERDPFVSADRSRFFFASDRRNGIWLDIYATRLNLPTYR